MRLLNAIPKIEAGPATGIDGLSEEGARQLARTIAKTWEARGCRVKTWIEQVSVPARTGKSVIVWRVQSDLVGGLPQSGVKTTKKKSSS